MNQEAKLKYYHRSAFDDFWSGLRKPFFRYWKNWGLFRAPNLTDSTNIPNMKTIILPASTQHARY